MTEEHGAYHLLYGYQYIISFNVFFERRNFDGVRAELLNRHWMIHGRDETKLEKVDVIRLFAAIHALPCVLHAPEEE